MLIADAQTLKDTGVLQNDGGIYALYRQTATRGGAAVVEEFLRFPLSDAAEINRRLGIIRSFSVGGTAFAFPPELFDAAEQYLADTDERSRLTGGEQRLGQKLAGLVATDAHYKTIVKGVGSLLKILTMLKDFAGSGPANANSDYEQERKSIEELLFQEAFVPLFAEQGREGKLSRDKLVEYDSLLRFRYYRDVRKLLRYVYQLDAYLAIGRAAAERNFCFPVALDVARVGRSRLFLENVWHPGVREAVGNSLRLGDGQNVLFLTGANMAGKSTLMKSVAIAVYLAHAGLPVPAGYMEFTALDGLFTTINLPDNLGAGASHFYAEVLRVKQVAQELHDGRRLMVLFDELFRGTNVKDAEEATIEIVKGFAGMADSLFIISTHIIEAGEALRPITDSIAYRYLPTRMKGHLPVYTYQLETGITEDRHGMVIIRNEGILEMLGHRETDR
jgi:DNA mismatch repair protein MutS